MIESKGWDWKIVKEEYADYWKTPSIESYYLLHRWHDAGFREFLDLGCGLGRHSILFGEYGFKVKAFDISEDAINHTKEWAESRDLSLDYKVGDMLSLPYEDESIDCVLCRNVISHSDTAGVKRAISEIKRVLKRGGECYMTLGSKAANGFKQDWPFVDENTKLRLKEGPEYMVPHFYADFELIQRLFSEFEIVYVSHIEDFYEKDGATHSSFHYHVLVKKNAGKRPI